MKNEPKEDIQILFEENPIDEAPAIVAKPTLIYLLPILFAPDPEEDPPEVA